MDRRNVPPASRSNGQPTRGETRARSGDGPNKRAPGADAFDPQASEILRHAAEKFDELFGQTRGP